MKTSQLERMAPLFRNVHAIGKKMRPFSDYVWMCEVDEQKGLAVGKTYRNAKQAPAFMHSIAEVERKKVEVEMSASKFISIMVDGSTDSSVMEEELLYVRSSRAGKVKVQFVGIQALEKADAEHVTDAICSMMSAVSGSEDEWKEKLVACATDGAAVMTGSKTGVKPIEQSYIKEEFLSAGHETPDAHQSRRYKTKSPDTERVNASQRNQAQGFCKWATDGATLKFCCFMHDTLTHLGNLSVTLQQSCLTVADVDSCLTSTQAVICKYKSRPGPMLSKVLDSTSYEGVRLSHSDTSQMMANKDKLLDKLSESMDNRFSDVGSGILSNTKIVSFQQWPNEYNEDFGDSEVERLIDHFRPVLISAGVDVDLIPDQWTIVKSYLYKEPTTLERLTWSEANRMLRGSCPDILDLLALVLCMPASTADCERGFNVMKIVKSDWRSSLKCETLSDLLMMHLSSPSIKDFDPSPAVQVWHASSLRSRRPDLMENRAAAVVEEVEESEGSVCSSSFEDSEPSVYAL
ncbi:zinc finger protein 862-like [Centropristis striata]|uniref:zinc finger protein 862-like n=1 Tax=Centropristis striata TaxID=184440 RepID=UPI0027E0BD34|nr:zinc finger protein 862-like [Centropristis striata]